MKTYKLHKDTLSHVSRVNCEEMESLLLLPNGIVMILKFSASIFSLQRRERRSGFSGQKREIESQLFLLTQWKIISLYTYISCSRAVLALRGEMTIRKIFNLPHESKSESSLSSSQKVNSIQFILSLRASRRASKIIRFAERDIVNFSIQYPFRIIVVISKLNISSTRRESNCRTNSPLHSYKLHPLCSML